ncbi:MAG: ABC transporter ATP-binding protein [Myxococcota bacterium]
MHEQTAAGEGLGVREARPLREEQGELAIELQGLEKVWRTGFRLKPVQTLFDLSLKVYPGEIYGFIGPNGAGKTTTIKILMGLARPTRGRVLIFGRDAQEVAQKAQVGYLPERPYFYEYLTAVEFLDFYGQLFKLPPAVRKRRIDELLERVSLSPHRNTALGRFSKGMLQRVGIAQALINDPALVVLDEPMSGLDPLGRMLMRDLILELRAKGKTVFFSTHILSDVELICDRVGIIVGGRRKEEGTLEELLHHRLKGIELVANVAEAARGRLEEALRPHSRQLKWQNERLLIDVADQEAQGRVLAVLQQLGAGLESVVPRRESLEELFTDELHEVKRTGKGG